MHASSIQLETASMAEPLAFKPMRRSPVSTMMIERPDLSLQPEPDLGIAKIQIFADPGGERFGEITGLTRPKCGMQCVTGPLAVAWLAPGEWLVIGPEVELLAWIERVDKRGDDDVLVVDLTHARVSFLLAGSGSRVTLATHCPLDLRSENIGIGAVARSLFGDAGLFLARLADQADSPRFRLIVDQTMAPYLIRLLAPGASR
jgi:sarcosine oxidase subunit gamma